MAISGRDVDYNPSVTIDDQVFNIALLMPSKAFELGAKLLKLVGEPVAALAMSKSEADLLQALPLAVRGLTSNMDNKETLSLIKILFQTVSLNGKSINFEEYFQGRMGHMFKVLIALINIQFSDFFQGVAESMKQITNLAKA